MNFRKLFNSKNAKNAGWLVFGKVIHMALSFVVGLMTARYLGPSNYGLINYASAYTTLFASLCTLGINSVIVKNLIDYPYEEGKSIGTTIVLRIASSILSLIMITSIVSVVDLGERTTVVVTALYSLGLVFESFDIFRQWFQSKLMSKYYAISTLIAYAVSSMYKLFLLATGKSVEWFALANTVDYVFLAIMLFVFYKKSKGPKLSFSLTKGKQLLAVSKSYILAGLMTAIYASTDKFMLKRLMDEATVGFYSLAVTVSSMWVFILSAIIESYSPSIMSHHNTNKDLYNTANRKLYAIVFYASFFASIFISIIARYFIGIVYGHDYLPAVSPLRIVVWYTAFAYLGVARNVWIVCEKKQKYLKYLYLGSAVLNIILNAVLIPVIGANGAAIASVAAEISAIFIFPMMFKPLRGNVYLMLEAIALHNVIPKRHRQKPES